MNISFKRPTLIILLAGVALSFGLTLSSLAQGSAPVWTPPVNVSGSGGATQPIIAGSSDGTLHVVWWDAIEGEQYARTTSLTTTLWTQPIGVPQIVGDRQVNAQSGETTITPPKQVQLAADTRGHVYAFWTDVKNQLLSAQTQGVGWSAETTLAEAATTIDLAADVSGTLRLAYVRSLNSGTAPAGIYYRSTTGTGWSASTLVYASPYFRTAKPEDVQVSTAGNGQGQAIVAWNDLGSEQSFFARSSDSGKTWSEPQAVGGAQNGRGGAQNGRVIQAQVAAATNGDWLMLWQDPATGGCGLTQVRSTDGGASWRAPERVLGGLNRCAGKWSFVPGGDGRLWLTITPLPDNQNADTGTITLAAWDDKSWSQPLDVSLNFFDAATQQTISIGCLRVTLMKAGAGAAGCDAHGDVWAARSMAGLSDLVPALTPVWSAPSVLSDRTGSASVQSIPAMAADAQGKFYALWSQSTSADEAGQALYAATWDNGRWSRAAQVLTSPDTSVGLAAGSPVGSKAEQPALAVDQQARLHAVWSGGTDGEIFYSWAYARDATSAQGWAVPIALPGTTTVGSWPDIVADPRGEVLDVIYAVPYNEARGIYLTRSIDGGATWLTPTLVFDAVAAGWDSTDKPRLALDAQTNVLHATWLQASLPGSTQPQAIFYSRSIDGGQTWSQAVKIAQGIVDWPKIVAAGSKQVYVAWTQSRSSGTASSIEVWGQNSPDGGERWTDPAAVRGLQVSGSFGLTADGAGHITLLGAGSSDSGESILQSTSWTGQTWGEVETLALGQPAAAGNNVVAALAPNQGQLIAVLRQSVMGSDNGRQDGGRQFAAVTTGRSVAVAPLTPAPTFTPRPTSTPGPTATPRPTVTPQPQLTGASQPSVESGLLQGATPLVLGAILAAAISLIVLVRALWARRH